MPSPHLPEIIRLGEQLEALRERVSTERGQAEGAEKTALRRLGLRLEKTVLALVEAREEAESP